MPEQMSVGGVLDCPPYRLSFHSPEQCCGRHAEGLGDLSRIIVVKSQFSLIFVLRYVVVVASSPAASAQVS